MQFADDYQTKPGAAIYGCLTRLYLRNVFPNSGVYNESILSQIMKITSTSDKKLFLKDKTRDKYTHLTDNVKSPLFEELGRAKKLQSTPLSINNSSAFMPLIVGQNHLKCTFSKPIIYS